MSPIRSAPDQILQVKQVFPQASQIPATQKQIRRAPNEYQIGKSTRGQFVEHACPSGVSISPPIRGCTLMEVVSWGELSTPPPPSHTRHLHLSLR